MLALQCRKVLSVQVVISEVPSAKTEPIFLVPCHPHPVRVGNIPKLIHAKTRRRWARERRGAEPSGVSMETYGNIILEDNILKMYNRQTRRVVSRQYITNTRQ